MQLFQKWYFNEDSLFLSQGDSYLIEAEIVHEKRAVLIKIVLMASSFFQRPESSLRPRRVRCNGLQKYEKDERGA